MSKKRKSSGCKGKKGDALKQCLKKYREDSKRSFPTFNQKTDTVVSATSKSQNVARSVSMGRARVASLPATTKKVGNKTITTRSGSARGVQARQKTYKDRSTGNYIVKTKVKKPKKKK